MITPLFIKFVLFSCWPALPYLVSVGGKASKVFPLVLHKPPLQIFMKSWKHTYSVSQNRYLKLLVLYFHRITEWLQSKGTFGGPCSSKDTCTCLLRAMSRCLLSVSTAFLGNLCQCCVSFTVKKASVSWCSEGTPCLSTCAHCLLFCHWVPKKSLTLPCLCPSFMCLYRLVRSPLWAFSSPD